MAEILNILFSPIIGCTYYTGLIFFSYLHCFMLLIFLISLLLCPYHEDLRVTEDTSSLFFKIFSLL